ncbi:DUF1772 domain-containing protein [Microbacterium saccharophilum]|uniref:DUF1772 domain-containing protein n=1 Tax=Microbacterium saccharophilum TaxID=1213358 RepID=A0A5C8HRR2_9MICO|nr:anthrone oxygenase family protein [Microbacterium saccharophilum]TXK08339.1 DUF1772 domain-containing protein [Microbacterium saccharophilum]GEP49324.1 membrane protein [Microbacterium saccharophilum]
MHALLLGPLLVVAIIANGLLAGLFFVFSVAIGPGLRRVDDGTYVRAFRAINTAILNGKFLTVFFVAPIAAVACAVLHLSRGGSASLPSVVAGAVCSALTFGVTAAGNVPLNQELDRAPIDTEHQRRTARGRFETRWNRRNLTRTLTSTGALTFLAVALVTG